MGEKEVCRELFIKLFGNDGERIAQSANPQALCDFSKGTDAFHLRILRYVYERHGAEVMSRYFSDYNESYSQRPFSYLAYLYHRLDEREAPSSRERGVDEDGAFREQRSLGNPGNLIALAC